MDLETILENFDAIVELPDGVEQVRSRTINQAILKEFPALPSFSLNAQDFKNFGQAVVTTGVLFTKICKWVKLGDLLTSLQNGISEPPNATEGIKILRINALRPNFVNLNIFRYINSSVQIHEYFLKPGDLLFTRCSGTKDFVGSCGVVPNHNESIGYPDKLIRGRLIEGVDPNYLSLVVNSGISREFIQSRLETTAGQIVISQKNIKEIPVPIASIKKQFYFAQKFNKLKTICDRVQQAKQARDELYKKLASTKLLA